MTAELTRAVCLHKLDWKRDSLEFMCVGGLARESIDTLAVGAAGRDGTPVVFRRVFEMVVLGNLVDIKGSTRRSLDHRFLKAEGCYWANLPALRGPGDVPDKLRSWQSGPATSAAHGASTWHLCQTTLHEIKRWEFQWLRNILRLRRRPDEGCLEYNARTSRLIVPWFHRYGVRMLHHRVLRMVFQSAWREKHHPDSEFVKHFGALRMYHSREWWDGARQIPWKWRRVNNAAQSVVSHPVEWEDVFCEVYGAQWRQVRDACPSLQVWRANLEYFTNTVCQAWGLPELPARATTVSSPGLPPRAKKVRSAHAIADCPAQHSLAYAGHHVEWGDLERRVAFVVDCQPVQRIAMGLLPLNDPASEQIFEGICDNLAKIIGAGWLPPQVWHDPVIWRKREHNLVADFLVNFTMDSQGSWSKHFDFPFPGVAFDSCNFIVYSDGGTRAQSCSATGWVIEVGRFVDEAWDFRPLVMSGRFFATPISSFQSEALALEECTLFLLKFLTCSRGGASGTCAARL